MSEAASEIRANSPDLDFEPNVVEERQHSSLLDLDFEPNEGKSLTQADRESQGRKSLTFASTRSEPSQTRSGAHNRPDIRRARTQKVVMPVFKRVETEELNADPSADGTGGASMGTESSDSRAMLAARNAATNRKSTTSRQSGRSNAPRPRSESPNQMQSGEESSLQSPRGSGTSTRGSGMSTKKVSVVTTATEESLDTLDTLPPLNSPSVPVMPLSDSFGHSGTGSFTGAPSRRIGTFGPAMTGSISSKAGRKSGVTSQALKLFTGTRVEYATMDDLMLHRNQLSDDINRVSCAAQEQFTFLESSIRSVTTQLDANVAVVDDALTIGMEEICKFTEDSCTSLQDSLGGRVDDMELRLQSSLESIQEELSQLRTKDIADLRGRLEAEIERICLQAHTHEVATKATLNKQGHLLSAADAELKRQGNESSAALARFDQRLSSIESLRIDREALQDATFADLTAKMEAQHAQLSKALMDMAEKCDEINSNTRDMTSERMDSLREAHGARMTSLETMVGGFHKSIAEATGVPTRRVEWVVNDISRHLSEAEAMGDSASGEAALPHRSLRSPLFDAAGAHNLQLELQLLQPNRLDAGHGCAVNLWGPKGLELVFKVAVGDASVRLTHLFDGERPCFSKSLCSVAEQICFNEDCLNVSLDIIEAVNATECISDDIQDGNGSVSKLTAQRYVNHNMLDMVQQEVKLMRSRMTRRVEWKVEQASVLTKCFAVGESLCSSSFSAAGLEGLQLIFYPSGLEGTKEDYCSLFVSCQAGCTLRFCLTAGTQRREAHVSFEHEGFYGRSNFCRFDNCVDSADDSVLLVLEIEEAQKTEKRSLSHVSAPRVDTSKPSGATLRVDHLSSSASLEDQSLCEDGRSTVNVSSVVKLQRLPGKFALEDVTQLPSIWTSKTGNDIGDVLEGFHRFSDMRSVRTPGSRNSPRKGPGQSMSTIAGCSLSVGTSKSDLQVPWKLATPRGAAPKTPGSKHRYQVYQ